MIKTFFKEHIVDVVTYISSKKQLEESKKKLIGVCHNFYPILVPNRKENKLGRFYYRLNYEIQRKVNHISSRFFYRSMPKLIKQIAEIAETNRYDIVQITHWYQGELFNKLFYKPFFSIDTQDVHFDKKEKELKSKYGNKISKSHSLELEKYKKQELKYTGLADLIISISSNDKIFFENYFPTKKHILIPSGVDLEHFNNVKKNYSQNKTILFYGGMGSKQNINAFYRLWEDILPIIKNKIPEVKLKVVGSNSPESIKRLNNGRDVIVTGYVEDVRNHISQTDIMILPMEIAGGFRCRVVEVMAMGIPVIGTHNALDCIGLEHGKHGFISDNNNEMAEYAVNLLNNNKLMDKLSENCIEFVRENYSFEKTYRKLSEYYMNEVI
ncbi:MAG: glycosyltransferase family 4 protein [Candidatus Aminicenantia bacterium]